jgi:hypothetical protein
MNKLLDESLSALALDVPGWDDGYDGANQNMVMVAIPTDVEITPEELVGFAYRARDIRREQVRRDSRAPVTFYMWTDEQAGQLRFSVCRRAPRKLPFGCTVDLVPDPESVVRAYLESPYRDGIPLSELTEVSSDESEDPFDAEDDDSFRLTVWADILT